MTGKKWSHFILLCMIGILLLNQAAAQQLAFPDAEGFGRFATGGRKGEVYHVTNLNDSGAGSLRDAVSKSNRIVVFDVGGIIHIKSRIVVSGNVYIAGQTAPGGGITVYGNGMAFNASNNITRYIRIRMGKNGDSGKDALSISSGQNKIFDHVSISWGRDGTLDVNGSGIDNLTFQDCIISQGINSSNHSTGGLLQSGKWSMIRSLYHSNKTRNPKARGQHEFINSVLYNWREHGYIMGDTEGKSECNLIGNYFIYGPSSNSNTHITGTTSAFHVYAHDNWIDSNKDGVLNGSRLTNYKTATVVNAPFSHPGVNNVMSAQNALQHVIDHVGASLVRDAVDEMLIRQLLSYGKEGRIVNTEDDNGIPNNVGTVANGRAPLDTDKDGMPDEWEIARGLNPFAADDKGDDDNDGYTNIEEYLSCLVGEGDCSPATGGPATLTKQGSGSSSQTLEVGQLIQGFSFAWTHASTVTVSGLPAGITASVNNTAKTVTFSGAPSQGGVFAYTITTVGGNPNTSAGGTFTVAFSQPAVITKHGGGSSSQTLEVGQAIQGFYFAWEHATTVTVTGLPAGINAVVNNTARTVTFSGASSQSGIFTYLIATQGGKVNATREGTFTVAFNQPAAIIKYGGGSSSQTIETDEEIQGFYFGWENAVTVAVAGLPAGISAVVNNTARTVTFSGAPAQSGTYTYTITTQGGNPDTMREGGFIVNDKVPVDCYGVREGLAYLDACGVCVGGITGFEECSSDMEAEEACEVEGILLEDRNEGFSGLGYVNTTNASGAYASWVLHSSASGSYTITFRFANGGDNLYRDARILVNGEDKGTLIFPPTGVWTSWANASIVLSLSSGIQELRLEALTEGGLANLDLLYFSEGLQASGCVITGFADKTDTGTGHVYPNPTSGIVHITSIPGFWRLTDSFGVELQSGSGEATIDLSAYPSGVYHLLTGDRSWKLIRQ